MKTHKQAGAAGFTLIELIITITIMVLLAALMVGAFAFVRDKQARETAKVQIALLSRGIDEYRLDMGVYPGMGASDEFGGNATSANGQNSAVLYKALFYDGWDFVNQNRPDDWDRHQATQIYLAELDPSDSSQGWLKKSSASEPAPDQQIIDPWGYPYRYRVGGEAMNPDFDLWSVGKDGRTQPGSSGSPYDRNHEDNIDDIRNF